MNTIILYHFSHLENILTSFLHLQKSELKPIFPFAILTDAYLDNQINSLYTQFNFIAGTQDIQRISETVKQILLPTLPSTAGLFLYQILQKRKEVKKQMKRILLSVMTIALVSTLAVGATRAYFSDTETVQNMTFATGTLSITDASASWTKTVNFQNLKPGDKVRKWLTIQNDGNLDVETLTLKATNLSDSDGLLQEIKVAVYNTVDGSGQGIYTPDWGNGQPVNNWFTSERNVLGTAVYNDSNAAHVLKPGQNATIILDFYVPTTLDNHWQGKSATFNIQIDAVQSKTGTTYF